MKILVEKRYMALPVGYEAQPKRLVFRQNGEIVFDAVTRLDPKFPETTHYLDMNRFLGEELELSCLPGISFVPRFADERPTEGLYGERYRPAVHFTASRGWLNDPNGLVWYEGKYHMFYQYNPADRCWGNMHWGHAVSGDLIHWEEREPALFPDELGTMFSGSAVVDERNLTGLRENDHDVLLLYYTAAGGNSLMSEGRRYSQCLAYSTDGGETFRKYAKNPLIPHRVANNRDPYVVYSPEAGAYLMALYLEENRFALYISRNLLDWRPHQELTLPEDGECPNLYPLETESGKRYWILSGALDRYQVGVMKDGRYQPVQPARSLHYNGNSSYAAQVFANVPGGRRLRCSWTRCRIPDSDFCCSMSAPTEMSLKEADGELLLCSWPVEELEGLVRDTVRVESRDLEADASVSLPLGGRAQDIRLSLHFEGEAQVSLSLLGLTLELFPAENRLSCGKLSMPLFVRDSTVRLRIITDVQEMEIFAADGEAYLCAAHLADYNLDRLELTARLGGVRLLELYSRELMSMWGGE